MSDTVEKSTASKVYWRLLPLAVLTYFLCYLDRINVGFAALTMNKDLGLDAATYGMAAGAFFWGYFLFEVPSNLILEKVGARIWIARIMISWGILSGATAFVVGPWSFLTMRFLLGLAEAGLFPGMILFFTYWFPDWHRARIMAGFTVALPLAVAAGAPMSTALLELNGTLGLAGWKWMFIAEAIPTVIVGFVFLFFVTDRPHHAHWLTEQERNWLINTLEEERKLIEATRKISLWQSFFEPRVLILTLNYFGIVTASLGLLLFLPQMVKQLGLSNMQVGWVSMIPYAFGALSMVAWGWVSDRMGERRWNSSCSLRRCRGRPRHRRHDHRHGLGGGRHDHCHHRTLRHQGAVLDLAVDDPDRQCGCVRHRLDQRHRQSRRLLRADCRRLDQDLYRKLCLRALSPRRPRAGIGREHVLAQFRTHSHPAGRARGRAGGVSFIALTSAL